MTTLMVGFSLYYAIYWTEIQVKIVFGSMSYCLVLFVFLPVSHWFTGVRWKKKTVNKIERNNSNQWTEYLNISGDTSKCVLFLQLDP